VSKIFIGCSGFHYKEWKEFFYPEKLPQSKWFEFYCEHFNTLELNSTFYKFPTEKSLANWHDTSPDDFKFSVKAPRLITHYKKFSECESLLHDFYSGVRAGLKKKLGYILFQLSPQIPYSSEFLQQIIKSIDPTFQNAFEFRNASWWNDDVFEKFKKNNLVFCGVSFPKLRDEVIKTGKNLYYRFHGVPVLYKSVYDGKFIENIYQQIHNLSPNEAWIYFNNTWGNAAIINSRYLQQIISNTNEDDHGDFDLLANFNDH